MKKKVIVLNEQSVEPTKARPPRISREYKEWNSLDSLSEMALAIPDSLLSYEIPSSPESCSEQEEGSNTSTSEISEQTTVDTSSNFSQMDCVHFHTFSRESQCKYMELMNLEKNVFISESRRNGHGEGIFASRDIKAGEIIIMYYGERITKEERDRRKKIGMNMTYMINIGKGVFIDGKEIRKGAEMANHRCKPNARLEQARLPGPERAPIAYLRATKDILYGRAINCNYGWYNKLTIRRAKEIIICQCGSRKCSGILGFNNMME